MQNLKIAMFWANAFFRIMRATARGNHWNMIHVDIDMGPGEDGKAVRERLVAMRRGSGQLEIRSETL